VACRAVAKRLSIGFERRRARPGWSYYLSNKKLLAARTIGFFTERHNNPDMGIARLSHCRFSRWRSALLSASALLVAASALADTPGSLRGGIHASACACKCNEGRTRAGCSKLCDSARRTARWGANSCAKPRFRKPADSHGAGPRLPHPPRAERASL